MIARLKPGSSLSEAQAQLQSVCGILQREYPATNQDLGARLLSLRQQTKREVNAPLLALQTATALMLLLACSNIASLLLAKGQARANSQFAWHWEAASPKWPGFRCSRAFYCVVLGLCSVYLWRLRA